MKQLKMELDSYTSSAPIMNVSDRSITMNGTHYVFATGTRSSISEDQDLLVTSSIQINFTTMQMHEA